MEKLSAAYFFRNLDRTELESVRGVTRITDAPANTYILRQGQPSDDLFIVRTGEVRVMLPSETDATGDTPSSDPDHTLTTLGPGECFGEFAFVDRKPSSASVVASTACTLYAVAHFDLERQILANPMTAAKFYKSMVDILVARFRNTDIELAVRKATGG